MRLLIFLISEVSDTLALKLIAMYLNYCFSSVKDLHQSAVLNLKLVFSSKSLSERESLFEGFKFKIAKAVLNFLRNPRIDSSRVKNLYRIAEQKNTLEELKKDSNGVGSIILCTHFDALEYLIHIPFLQFKPIHTLARGFKFPRVDKWWKSRNNKNRKKIYDGEQAFAEIIKKINEGHNVLIVCDQAVNSRKLAIGDFFGLPAASSRIITLCAMQTGCSLVMGAINENEKRKKEFILETILNPAEVKGSNDKKIKEVSRSIHRAYERRVGKEPLSWFWIHRLWDVKQNRKIEEIF